jgi:hypothetical protein
MMEVGRQYDAEIHIFHDKAIFWLDGEMYYSAVLAPGDVALQGKLGFTSCTGQGSSVIFHVVSLD